jgi:nicotinamide-nucleotide amidase
MSSNLISRAAILAVGTEITSGQIVNGNAAWIARRIVDLGAEVVLHETVPDDRPMIRAALDRSSEAARLVVVTGGLGPTTDDFTREALAEWAGLPLEFHEPSWKKIEERLGRLGIPVAPSNRQQCFFPRGSQVLPNAQGTADGFHFTKDGTNLWVLPGPPAEIASIWEGERASPAPAPELAPSLAIDVMIRHLLPPDLKRLRLFTWDCLGKSESELGELVEEALKGSGFQTGYRVHRPYVEVKVWISGNSQAEFDNARPWIARLETAIKPWLVGRQGEDIGSHWFARLRDQGGAQGQYDAEIEILDACTGGLLADRVGALLRKPENRILAPSIALATEWDYPHSPESWVESALSQANEESFTFAIAGMTAQGEWALGLRQGSRLFQEKLKSPWRHIDMLERARSFAVETAIGKWTEWLSRGH